MSSATNPIREIERLFEQMQANLEDAGMWWEPKQLESVRTGLGSVSVDLEDTGDELVLTAELPGYERDDVDVRVSDHVLHLDAEYEESAEETEGEFLRRERHRGSVSRSIRLPEAVVVDDIEAAFNNGVLTVRMPKLDPADQGTEIDID